MIMALTQVLGVSAVALISQAVGRKDQEHANLIFNQSLVLSALCAVITLLGGYLFAESYLRSITADEAALSEGLTFLFWFLPGMALQFAMMAMASSLRATGIVKAHHDRAGADRGIEYYSRADTHCRLGTWACSGRSGRRPGKQHFHNHRMWAC